MKTSSHLQPHNPPSPESIECQVMTEFESHRRPGANLDMKPTLRTAESLGSVPEDTVEPLSAPDYLLKLFLI